MVRQVIKTAGARFIVVGKSDHTCALTSVQKYMQTHNEAVVCSDTGQPRRHVYVLWTLLHVYVKIAPKGTGYFCPELKVTSHHSELPQ